MGSVFFVSFKAYGVWQVGYGSYNHVENGDTDKL